MEAAEQTKKKPHNPQMSAGCQCLRGTAIKSAEGLLVGRRAGEKENNAPGDSRGSAQGGCQRPEVAESLLLRQPSLRRATLERASRRGAIACGLQSVRGCSPAGTERWLILHGPELVAPCCHQPGKEHRRDGGSALALGCSAKLPKLTDGNESALSAEGCLSRIFGARKNVEFLERAWPPTAVQTTLPRR